MRDRRRPHLFSRAASTSAPRPFLWLIGLLGVAAVVLMSAIGFNAPNKIPGRSYYTVTAQFADADNLTAHYQVKVAGRLVGQVLNPRVEDGKGLVDLQLDPKIGRLPVDSTVRVRPRSAIGVRFVDVTPGKSEQTIPEGGRINAKQTSASTALDDVLGTLDAKRRAKAQRFIREIGAGLADRGDTTGELIGDLPTALNRVERLSRAVNDRPGAARSLVVGTDSGMTALAPAAREYAAAARAASPALEPIAKSADDLLATVDKAPAALSTARDGLSRTDRLLDQASGLAREALPTLRPAPAGLRQASHLLADSSPGLRGLRSTLDTAQAAVPPTLDLLQTADPLLPSVSKALVDAGPTVDRLGVRGCDIALWAKNWGSMLTYGIGGGRKDLGQIVNLRLNVIASDETLSGQTSRSTQIASSPYPAPCKVQEDRR